MGSTPLSAARLRSRLGVCGLNAVYCLCTCRLPYITCRLVTIDCQVIRQTCPESLDTCCHACRLQRYFFEGFFFGGNGSTFPSLSANKYFDRGYRGVFFFWGGGDNGSTFSSLSANKYFDRNRPYGVKNGAVIISYPLLLCLV